MNAKKVVVTGGPGSGKTSIINELKIKGFHCFDEIIRIFTNEVKKNNVTPKTATNPIAFVNDPIEFNMQLLNGRKEQFIKATQLNKQISFFDRGVPDVLAYMDFFDQKYDKIFVDVCEKCKYTDVFILPPWEDIYVSDNERFETYEQAVIIHECLERVYKNFGYRTIEVPFGSVADRANYIIENL